ncbi:hypothetical protein [Dokdonella sp.]|uniref:hypothetical protein n=1 Tax=Dokdonella sp. TaxID=2291710 RepID=UPI0031BBF2C7|nr:hypothetical protein [Dokdonella sp.]
MSFEDSIARDTAATRQAALESTSWLTAEEIAWSAGLRGKNPVVQVSRWKRENKVFSVSMVDGTERFPAYLLEPVAWRPLPETASAIAALASTKDGWGMAYWFASVNSFLGGKRPMDLIGTEPQRVAAAAADEAAGIQHG